MKSIADRAEKYVSSLCDSDCALCDDVCRKSSDRIAFIAGAESEHEELTSWHNPDKELPDTIRNVLVKTTSCLQYRIAFYMTNAKSNSHWFGENEFIDDDEVLGWREIHE